jgi:hypothetical protein
MITLPHETDSPGSFPPYWRLLRAGENLSATLVCPQGHRGSLLEHDISDDGVVTPSCVCPFDGCTWHEIVRLDGWRERSAAVGVTRHG